MSTIRSWFVRSSGQWTSNRRYFYEASGRNQLVRSELSIEMRPSLERDFAVQLDWTSSGDLESQGSMLCEYDQADGLLYRNIGYMTEAPTVSRVSRVDADTLVFDTEYDGLKFREEIRLVEDNVRLRQTLGWKRNEIFLAGEYFERRTD